MKIFIFLILIFSEATALGQSKKELEIIELSNTKFRLEMKNDGDSMADILDDSFIGISSAGVKRTKSEYLANIKNTSTIHNSMDIQETNVSIFGKTAILTGKGFFVVTTNNVKSTLYLAYLQVFIKRKQGWKMIALQGSRIPD